MKLSKERLKRIIQEELELIQETNEGVKEQKMKEAKQALDILTKLAANSSPEILTQVAKIRSAFDTLEITIPTAGVPEENL